MTAMQNAQPSVEMPYSVMPQLVTKSVTQSRCGECPLRKACLPQACGAAKSEQIEHVVQHIRPVLRRKDVLFRAGDRFEALYVIRAGSVKTVMLSENGEEQITGFYLPGDIIGVDGVSTGRSSTTAIALETTSVCTLPFSQLEKLASSVPEVQRYVFQVMAKEILQDQQMMFLLSRKNAEQRLATLLLRFSQHLQSRRLFAQAFRLSMSRNDIGNYLGLAVETVCRVMTRFQKLDLVKVDGREITLTNIEGLQEIANAANEVH